ncbi:MAG TPA: hypothetical protein VKY82_06400 [Flavobacterium sp.]|nr:hypothetical protein [Flavobacterium sp.]
MVIILATLISSCHVFNRYEVHLKGLNNEVDYEFSSTYRYNPLNEGFTSEPNYLDSLGNPYTGVVIRMLCKRKDSATINNAVEIDSMCVYKGKKYGYSKTYSSVKSKSAGGITYINQLPYEELSNPNHLYKYRINTGYKTKQSPKTLWFSEIVVLKHNLKFYCRIYDLNRNIKVKTKIERIGDELGSKQSIKIKHKTKLKEKSEIKDYFKLFPEIISQEILDRCQHLGMFDHIKVKDPIIIKNCNFN